MAQRFGLTSENCPKHPSNYTKTWVRGDFTRGVDYFILESDGKPMGCGALEMVEDDLCYLERLAVLPQFRRRGHGRRIVDYIMDVANTRGARRMSIGIISAQTNLNQWYRKIGFVEGDTREFKHLPFQVTLMAYDLNLV